MKSIDIAIKDLKRAFRSAILLVFMFVIPLLVSTLFYFMFGNINQEGGFNLPRTKVVVANLDTNAPRLQAGSGRLPGGIKADTLSELVVNVLESKDLADLLQVSRAVDAAAARLAVDQQQAQVALIIPKDFSRQFADLNGEVVDRVLQRPHSDHRAEHRKINPEPVHGQHRRDQDHREYRHGPAPRRAIRLDRGDRAAVPGQFDHPDQGLAGDRA